MINIKKTIFIDIDHCILDNDNHPTTQYSDASAYDSDYYATVPPFADSFQIKERLVEPHDTHVVLCSRMSNIIMAARRKSLEAIGLDKEPIIAVNDGRNKGEWIIEYLKREFTDKQRYNMHTFFIDNYIIECTGVAELQAVDFVIELDRDNAVATDQHISGIITVHNLNQAIRLIENTSTDISPAMKKEKAKIIQWQNIREKSKMKAN